jgi:hypothetical protein
MTMLIKYDRSWVGIDGGREGLWKEPIWKGVLRIAERHVGDNVYDSGSSIYEELERSYPDETWRSQTAEGQFRPLFRDYPNSWTRTGVLTLTDQRFDVTNLGRDVLAGKVSKSQVLVGMFVKHSESSGPEGAHEKPFAILVSLAN